MAERITAPIVKGIVENHLQQHKDKFDPKLHQHAVILFGERGDDGLCVDMREVKSMMKTTKEKMDKYEANINKIVLLIIGTLLTAILDLIMNFS